MRVASFVVGLVGGILALLLSLLALAIFATGNALNHRSGDAFAARSGAAAFVAIILLTVTTLIFAGRHQKIMGVLEIVAAVVGLLLAGGFFIGGVLSIVAGLLAIFAHPDPDIPRLVASRPGDA